MITAILALLALAILPNKPGIVAVWVFNIVGAADLLYALFQGDHTDVGVDPGLQGAAYFITTVLVPLALVTHALVFGRLLRRTT